MWACTFEVRQFTVLPVSGNVCVAGLIILYGLQVSGRKGPGGGPFEYNRITYAVLDMIIEHRRSDLILHTEHTRVTPNLVNECVLINMTCYTHSLIPMHCTPCIPPCTPCTQVFWFSLVAKVAWNMARGADLKDTRSESESEGPEGGVLTQGTTDTGAGVKGSGGVRQRKKETQT